MKNDSITLNINANLKVDKRTAVACLKLIEVYCNNVGAKIIVKKEPDGSDSFEYMYKGIAEEFEGEKYDQEN